jgi:hypothetical protein
VAARGEDEHISLVTDVVDAQIEAYQARDVEKFLACYADDASVALFDGTVMFATKDVMREQYGNLFAASPDLTVTIASRQAAGEFVVDEEHLSGFNAPGMPTELVALCVYRVTGGRISRLMLLM